MVALPDQLFYNTGISTYFWVVTNRKDPKRRGKVQLIDARNCFVKMRKSLGEKRKQVSDSQIADIVRAYGQFTEVDGDSADGNEGDPKPSVKFFPTRRSGFCVSPSNDRFVCAGRSPTRASRRSGLIRSSPRDDQSSIIAELRHSIHSHKTDEALRDLAMTALKRAEVKGKPYANAIVDAFAIRDLGAKR